MKTRVVALTALAVLLTAGLLAMHALGVGHHAVNPTVGMSREHSAHTASEPFIAEGERAEQPAHPAAGFATVLCVAVLSVGLSFVIVRSAARALANTRLELLARPARGALRPRTGAGPLIPLVVPLRS